MRLENLSAKHVISVSANDNYTACVTKYGEVHTWGKGGAYFKLERLSFVTEQLAEHTNETIGALLNGMVVCRISRYTPTKSIL